MLPYCPQGFGVMPRPRHLLAQETPVLALEAYRKPGEAGNYTDKSEVWSLKGVVRIVALGQVVAGG